MKATCKTPKVTCYTALVDWTKIMVAQCTDMRNSEVLLYTAWRMAVERLMTNMTVTIENCMSLQRRSLASVGRIPVLATE